MRGLLLVLMALLFAGQFSGPALAQIVAQNALPDLSGHITIMGTGGQPIGSATIKNAKRGYVIEIALTGLLGGWHGVQIHAVGDCTDLGAFLRSGPIVGLAGEHHGLYNPAGPMDGDLPNIWIGADGNGHAQFYDPLILPQELGDADGAAIVITSGADDLRSEPEGQSGTRVGCGVITANRLPPAQ